MLWTLLLVLLFGSGSAAQSACAVDRVTLYGDWGQAAFAIAVADEPQERSQGLMFVEEMPMMSGMLFVYEAPQRVSFWMRNTLIPLDMIFADATGLVQHVHENAVPLDETGIPGGENIQFVLEINGGMAGRLGIGPGDVMQHPSIVAAVRPCP